jgi:hypothetical protein
MSFFASTNLVVTGNNRFFINDALAVLVTTASKSQTRTFFARPFVANIVQFGILLALAPALFTNFGSWGARALWGRTDAFFVITTAAITFLLQVAAFFTNKIFLRNIITFNKTFSSFEIENTFRDHTRVSRTPEITVFSITLGFIETIARITVGNRSGADQFVAQAQISLTIRIIVVGSTSH